MDCPLATQLGADMLVEAPDTSQPHRTRTKATRKSCKTRRQGPHSSTLGLVERGLRMILTTTCILVLATQMVRGQLQAQDSLLAQQDTVSTLLQQAASTAGSNQQPQLQQQQPQPRPLKQIEYLVRPNSPARIECKLPPLVGQPTKNRTIYWNFHGTTTQNPRLLCYGDNCIGGSEHGLDIDFDQTTGTYDLVISNATYELNDGVYYCDFQDKSLGSRFVREFRLTVLLEPQQPVISASSASAREGQEYQLSCQSSGGNPEPNITWFKNGIQLLAGQGLRIEQTRQNGTTTGVLTWIPTIDDHEAVYKCDVANKAMGDRAPLTQAVTISVEYAPRISVGPFNPLKVMQGERATISCQVDANPPVKSIRWFRDGHQVLISNQFNHTIHEVKISDAAVYSCQADNGIAPFLLGPANSLVAAQAGAPGSGVFSFLGIASSSSEHSKTLVEARLQLEVLYAPRVQVRDPEAKTQPLNENDALSLNCSVDSWPPAHEFVWTKADDESWRRTGPLLDFQSLTANDMGNYTCTAFNRLEPSGAGGVVSERQGSANFTVYVRHRPGLADIIVGQNGQTEVGNQTLIKCRAKPPGYPEPKYTFWKVSQKGQRFTLNKSPNQDSLHTLWSARPEDEGKYGCIAQNPLGSSSEAFSELAVNEAPMIIEDQTLRNFDEKRPGDHPYSITVRATGKPEPRVTWYHRSPVDGRRIELSSAEMQSRFHIDTRNTSDHLSLTRSGQSHNFKARSSLVSTLTFRTPLEVDDRGLYTVEFSNGLSRIAVQNYQLHIEHAPIPAIKNLPVVYQPANLAGRGASSGVTEVAARTRAGFNIGESVTLVCRVSAYPKPSFLWHVQSSLASDYKTLPREGDPRYRTDIVNVQDDIWEGTLSFTLESESDYGDYMCATANSNLQSGVSISPNMNILIHLERKSIPEPPVQVDQIDAAQDSVTIQWIPGFDGGFTQNQFIVQYALDDASGLSLMRRYGPAIDEQQLQSMTEPQPENTWPKLYDCLTLNPCTISGLQPRQAYLMRLQARNELGSSRGFSEELRVSTRANITEIPRMLEAYFDSDKNILRFRVEPNPEYLLNNLVVRIDARGSGTLASPAGNSLDFATTPDQYGVEWQRFMTVPVRHEQGDAYLNLDPKTEQLRLTLCMRLNDTLCGPEFVISTQSAVVSFMRDQHGFTISILASTLILILLISGTATTLYSCCHSRKAKKAAGIDRVDVGGHLQDNKALSGHINGGLSLNNGTNGVAGKVGTHGSTTSTNSTSANGQLQSMDSINNGHLSHHNNGGGSTSDHSSDHSRQAKLDSMLPPNYSHYADRASLMLEQQQQQQQQQQAYMQEKLGSPFGLPNGAMLFPNQMEPQIGDYFGSYDPSSAAVMSSLEQHPMDAQANSMMMNSVLSNGGQMYDPSQMNEASMYSTHQQMVDEYNNYNALANQQHDQMMESAYGTTTAPPSQVMAQPHQASYDNNTNQSYCQSYGSPYDQQQQQQQLDSNGSHYQQDLAAAQQQMYGTLTRNLSGQQQANGTGNNNDSSPSLQQQQEQYLGAAGLMPPPPPPQESDYGTTGRNGRLIREIIV